MDMALRSKVGLITLPSPIDSNVELLKLFVLTLLFILPFVAGMLD